MQVATFLGKGGGGIKRVSTVEGAAPELSCENRLPCQQENTTQSISSSSRSTHNETHENDSSAFHAYHRLSEDLEASLSSDSPLRAETSASNFGSPDSFAGGLDSEAGPVSSFEAEPTTAIAEPASPSHFRLGGHVDTEPETVLEALQSKALEKLEVRVSRRSEPTPRRSL